MKEVIQTDLAPAAIGAYSQAIKAGQTVYLSGQVPLDPVTGLIVEGGFEAQAIQVFKNLHAVIQAANSDFDHVVKVNAYLTDLRYFSVFNEVMASFIKSPFPARAAVQVAALPKDALVEVEAILFLD